MSSKEINEQVQRSIEEYGSLPDITPSDAWNDKLISRLQTSKKKNVVGQVIVVSICLITALNLAVGIGLISRSVKSPRAQESSMEQLSRELLITPASTKE